jgi:hypothetical protein
VLEVRELRLDEVQGVKRGSVPAVKRFRDSHHRMAQLFACGLKTKEVAELTGYSLARVSTLRGNPAFDDLVDQKRGLDEVEIRDGMQAYYQIILENGLKAERKLADKLDDDDETEELSVRELISISRDSADRVGLSKRTVQTNISVDFAQMLDRAIARTRTVKQIEAKAISGTKTIETQTSSISEAIVETNAVIDEIVKAAPKFKRRM